MRWLPHMLVQACLLFGLVCAASCFASDAPAAANDDVVFARDIQPLFARHCLLCHGPDKAEAGLRLDVAERACAELESGARAIEPGNADASELLRRVASDDEDERMPPKGDRLTGEEVALLKRWIEGGAKWEQHWAYRPLSRAAPPQVENVDWVRNGIDRFVLARLEQAKIAPSPEADRYTLIKRLYYDLVGLPPEPAEAEAFFNDTDEDAYEKLVDRLLASGHFGERWGRHWLDKARYADSDGYEKDNHRADAWRYRDWVIQAINDDMPFDRFTIEQLAGDMLPGATPLERLATAFNRQTLTNTEGGTDREQWRVAAVMDRTETLGTVWLGLTVGCARCHNHKYDQFTQREYYQLFAYFNNGDEVNAKAPRSGDHGEMMSVRVIGQRTTGPRTTHILRRGDFKQPLAAVTAGTPTTLPPIRPREGHAQTDRLDLARWLVSGRNPLPTRVAANHVWQHLFGAGIVPTMNDFGVRGDRPSHPLLLDHLAAKLIDEGWSRKALIKYIVMSATYRQSSRHRPELADVDPTNRLLHRQNRYRVEAEIIRDVTLAAAGLLSRKIGGPSVFPPIPASVTDLTYNSSFKWKTSTGEDRYRRGMYTYFKRTAPHPNLITFDCPDSNVTNVERDRSNTPIGVLVTLNNETYVEAAQAMAQHVLVKKDVEDDAAKLRYALRRCIARVPSEEEIGDFAALLETSRGWYNAQPEAAKHLVGNRPADGVAPAENAAWIATLRMMLNLDEFITRE